LGLQNSKPLQGQPCIQGQRAVTRILDRE